MPYGRASAATTIDHQHEDARSVGQAKVAVRRPQEALLAALLKADNGAGMTTRIVPPIGHPNALSAFNNAPKTPPVVA